MRKLIRKLNFGLGWKRKIFENPITNAFYANVVNSHRLKLPSVPLDSVLQPESRQVRLQLLPCATWDTGYDDLVALCALSLRARPARILEIGTCRGRATMQLALNNPDAQIVTYDINAAAGEYFHGHPSAARIEQRIVDFPTDRARLVAEPRFDFIYIDGSHVEECVKNDSALAFDLVSAGGIIVWHDYSNTGGFLGSNAVPEILAGFFKDRRILGVAGTNLAFWSGEPPAASKAAANFAGTGNHS